MKQINSAAGIARKAVGGAEAQAGLQSSDAVTKDRRRWGSAAVNWRALMTCLR